MNKIYLLIIIVIYVIYNFYFKENFGNKIDLIDLYNKTIVRIRSQKNC